MGKSKILIIADVEPWAWGIKSRYLQKHLSDEFDVDICYINQEPIKKYKDVYDVYLTYIPAHLKSLEHIDRDRKLTGLTGMPCYNKWFKGKGEFDDRVVGLHANSEQFRKLMEPMHKKVYYVPNGIDTELFSKQPFVERKNIVAGYVGKPIAEKGLNNIIKPAIKLAGKKVKVGLKTNISNWKSASLHKSLVDFYKDIDVYLVASTMDGTPNPALEAAACGRTIISNRIGNMPEFINNGINGFLVERNIKKYADKLVFLSQNKDMVKLMGRRNRKAAEEWDWSIKADNYRNMFKEVLGL